MRSLLDIPCKLRGWGWRGIVFLSLLLILPISQVVGSVLVAPTVIFLSDQNRTGRMILQNPTNEPREITVRFSFGLPISDSLGNVQVRLDDSLATDPRSCAEWIRAFPRKMILQPGATQTVRFVARPPKNLADGEYWARVVVRSQESKTDIPVASDAQAITTNLNMIMQTAISLKYRTGDLTSTLQLADAEASLLDSQVVVMLGLSNKGNISYLGVLQCRLLDAENKEVSTYKIDLAVYYDMLRRIELPVPAGEFKPPFRVELSIVNEGRTDVPPEFVVHAEPVESTLAVR